ncbi:MAG: 16S rRNA (uracil(1498)-N(3))-methyltransferase [Flavobacteriaceae bacterium]
MQLFYHPDLKAETTECFFGEEESRHIIKVLRKKKGDELKVTNGKGRVFTGTVSEASLNCCELAITSHEKTVRPMHRLHLAVAPTKNSDRFEWFLEKATEIGIDEITPIICDHSERKFIKNTRLQKVILSAMKQSLRSYLPRLNEAITFEEFLQQDLPKRRFIAHCQEGEKVDFKRRLEPDKKILVMVGPEGDFSEAEIEMAKDKGFIPASLGEYRLRTETAAILACTTVALINSR